jgi:peptide/nickel transport system permease protein
VRLQAWLAINVAYAYPLIPTPFVEAILAKAEPFIGVAHQMAIRILARIGHALLSMLFLLVLVFVLVRLTGDPSYVLLPEDASPESRMLLRQELGLDQPLLVQFKVYMEKITEGDLGTSFRSRIPVTDLIALRLPNTILLGVAAILLIILVGVPLGIYSAYWQGGRVDRVVRFMAAIGQAIPDFWLGLILILFFAVYLGILPSGGRGGIEHLILPAITLAFVRIAGLIRLLRSSMIETLTSDYVMFLRIKGLPERRILWKHALRNAGLTTLTFIGLLTAGLLTGSVLVETVFGWPGAGRLMTEAIRQRDFAVVQGVMLLFASVYIGVNLLVDVLYVFLNPRLR